MKILKNLWLSIAKKKKKKKLLSHKKNFLLQRDQHDTASTMQKKLGSQVNAINSYSQKTKCVARHRRQFLSYVAPPCAQKQVIPTKSNTPKTMRHVATHFRKKNFFTILTESTRVVFRLFSPDSFSSSELFLQIATDTLSVLSGPSG